MIRPWKAVWLVALRELRAQRLSFLAWLGPLSLLMMGVVAMQPSIAGERGLLAANLAALPEAMKQVFAVGQVDFNRPAGYLATNFLTVTLLASLFAGLLGAAVVAREDAQRTSEALLTLPLARWQVLMGKLLASLGLLATFHLVLGGVVLATFARVVDGPIEADLMIAIFLGAAALGLCFFSMGFAMAVLVKQARAAPTLSLGLVLGTSFLGAVSRLSARGEVLGLLSPYGVVDPAGIVERGGLQASTLWLLGVAVALLGFALLWYDRRDVHA